MLFLFYLLHGHFQDVTILNTKIGTDTGSFVNNNITEFMKPWQQI